MDLFVQQQEKQKQKEVDEKQTKLKVAPWVEKYRPTSIDQVVYQDEVVSTLKKVVMGDTSNFTHMLFYGPPGTGKTTTILAVCRDLFGPEYYARRVKELNASDDCGIDVIRDKVKKFAKSAVTLNPNHTQGGVYYPVPPFQVVVLDEADALTPAAQAAFRRVMEDYTVVTRFVLICNYISKIMAPIASRCAKYRFKPITREPLRQRILYIAGQEGLTVSDDNVAQLDMVSKGDLRCAITYLFAAHRMAGLDLTSTDMMEVAGWVPMQVVDEYFESLFSNDLPLIQTNTRNVVMDGYSATRLLHQIHDLMVRQPSEKMDSIQKARAAIKIAAVGKRLHDGGDEYLQLLDLAVYIMKLLAGG